MPLIHEQWPKEVQELSGVCDAIIHTDNGPIYVACIYGLHQGLPESRGQTDLIIQTVFQRSELLRLPALIVGDLNAGLEELVTWPLMVERGWSDCAMPHFRRTGIFPGPTCKESTRIDYILMNNMASQAFDCYYTSDLPVSDHRQIFAEFSWSSIQRSETIWKMPRDYQDLGVKGEAFESARVPVVQMHKFDVAIRDGDVEQSWKLWLQASEQVADSVMRRTSGVSLPKTFEGKLACKFVERNCQPCLIAKGRADTLQMPCEAAGVKLRQRVRQVRRFDSILAQWRARGPLTEQRATSMRAVWEAIIKAPGFGPSFPSWCLHELDAFCPIDIPSRPIAIWFREKLASLVPKWRSLYTSQRLAQVRETFSKDWDKGGRLYFRALKGEQSPPVDAIDRTDVFRVHAMKSKQKSDAKFKLSGDDLHIVKIGQMWRQGDALGVVSSIKEGTVHVRMVKGMIKSGPINAFTTCTDPHQSLHLAVDYWSSFWSSDYKFDKNDPQITDLVRSIPARGTLNPEITLPELNAALKSLQNAKARGMDATTNWELKHLCEDQKSMLLRFKNLVNKQVSWPASLTKARMHLIRKTEEAGDITSTRPICILPNVYRLWGKIMTAKCFKHLRGLLPASLCGSVPGRSSTDLAMMLQTELEHHLLQNIPLFGAALDLHKAFNTLDRDFLEMMCDHLGLSGIWLPYKDALQDLQRFFTIRKKWSHAVLSNTGCPEGCPLSVVMMVLVAWFVTNAVSKQFHGRTVSSYVDDWTSRDTTAQGLVQQIKYVQELAVKLG